MHAGFLYDVFNNFRAKEAIICRDKIHSYESLLNEFFSLKEKYGILKGKVVAIEGDFSFSCIATIFSLIENNCIIIPLNNSNISGIKNLIDLGEAECKIHFNENDDADLSFTGINSGNHLYETIRKRNNPGLVLFSSGSTGDPKCAVHDLSLLLDKFRKKREPLKTLAFLLFDHWGGLNTMFHTLSNGGTLIHINERTPDNVCALTEKYKAELLPATPTFLNLIILSEAYKRFDLSSLKVISYGTEPMSKSTLKKLNEIFPGVIFKQTYGLIELGVMRAKSKESGSLWLKLGGEGFETRVIDNMLQIKSKSAILGYLNYPSPFTDDGWFITGDEVITDGEYFKILGRVSQQINVGGEKVYPAEVESVIGEMDNVGEVRVYGEKNPITGSIVCADVLLIKGTDKSEFRRRIKIHCNSKLQSYKVPVKINFVDKIEYNNRFKKISINR